ncbi:predicted protein [Sclerotinia sclerotiorum 1980 UF-70]|uniref:Uncharacterized protein n=1 Tax=Sclerotinia sclerotiorum (strain ATCC 18683 / 1980 / Ss-1) TaxID=665079 RepID=A7EJS5_SCLS1|nr:predicted protein [Sclerotinia sclerotiorum 1980 UF-70]EDO03091.1 predicted protein [Sclerotinia sclerotiorum 1980 UF-70]
MDLKQSLTVSCSAKTKNCLVILTWMSKRQQPFRNDGSFRALVGKISSFVNKGQCPVDI